MGDAGQESVSSNSRRRVAIGAALAAIAVGAVLVAGYYGWPRLRKAAHQVEWMRRRIQSRTTPPVRKKVVAGRTGIRLSSILVACDISPEGRPLHPTSVVPATACTIYIFFDYSGARKGDTVTSDWFLNGRYQPVKTVPVELPPGEGHGHLQLKLSKGETLPAGRYRVDLIFEDAVVGSVDFTVDRPRRRW